jgi:signal transduction histidine kinase
MVDPVDRPDEERREHLQMLGEMLVGIAHEMNTPVGVLVSMLDGMRRCHARLGELAEAESLGPEQHAQLRDLVARLQQPAPVLDVAVERLQGLVRELRLVGRPQEEDPFEPVRLVPVIEGDLLLLQFELKQGVTVERRFEAEPVVRGRATWLGQVFLNLLRNAIQALDHHGTITVTVRERGGAAEVIVADDGPGIAEDVLPRLFQRECTTKGREAGTGVGLLLSERIVRKHGGSIAAANAPAGGAVFTVTLPLA